jgi:hypothetical protein
MPSLSAIAFVSHGVACRQILLSDSSVRGCVLGEMQLLSDAQIPPGLIPYGSTATNSSISRLARTRSRSW